ncbi:hypothetical protein [Flagellimonas marinaquae]|uniref:GNAT family N-acetyltransferase n=1 Tax=Flagellimonas marinaquae TaxID=254955 RepID=UPI0028BDDD87|nr:hypothetical protein [Allomuricauda aquimarina]
MTIRTMKPSDWEAVARIYSEGIATGFATFETQTPSYDHWDKAHTNECRLVAEKNDVIAGWAALSPVSSRCVYGGVAEVSVLHFGPKPGSRRWKITDAAFDHGK